MAETLGDAHDQSWQVRVLCAWGKRNGMKSIRRECTFNAPLDLATLLWTRAPISPWPRSATVSSARPADPSACP